MSQNDAMLQVLAALMSPDNAHRQQAEVFFTQQLETTLLETISSLISILGATELDITLRNMSGILLRRAIDPASSYGSRISRDDIQSLRTTLMNIWAAESQPVLLKRLSHIIAQSAAAGEWDDLIPQLVGHGSTQAGDALLPILNLIEILAEYCPEDIGNHSQALVSLLGGIIANTETSTDVQVACAKAIGSCLVTLEDGEEEAKDAFRPALSPLVQIMGAALERGDELDAAAILEHLVEVAAQQPMFFKGVMDSIVSSMLSVVSSEGLEFSTRSLALELMVTLAESAPALARRCEGLIKGVVPLAMTLMLELDDDEQTWQEGGYSEQEQGMEDENAAVGEEALERLAAGLGGRTVGPLVISLVEQYASSPDAAYRRAAVATLCRLAEGASKIFQKSYLTTTFDFLQSSLQDASPRVQYQSLQAVGQLAVLYPDSIGLLIDLCMPAALVHLTASHTCDRVKGHCLSALINLTNPSNCSDAADVLQKHLDALLSALWENLTSSSLEVQPVCLQLLGGIAQLAGDGFAPYYSAFMPGVKGIMCTATAPHLATLRGKAMECVGLVGEAVGDEVFAQDAQEVMEILLSAMGQSDDDTTFDHILPACARISKTLGANFRPFLPLVMPPMLAGALQEISFSMVDAEEGDDEGENVYDEETGTESAVISMGAGIKKRVTLNTHAVQKKNQCGRMIYEFAANMKGHLQEYLLPCVQATLPMVLDKHYSEIRSSASLALVKLFEAGIDATRLGFLPPAGLQELLESILDQLLLAVKGEINASSRICAADAMRDVVEACFLSGTEAAVDGSRGQFMALPSAAWSRLAVQHLMAKCQESVVRREDKIRAFEQNEGLEGGEDEESFAEELEEEEDLLATLVDALGFLLKLHGEPFMELIDEKVAPAFAPYLDPSQPAALQTVAVCMLDDIFEFGGAAALKYVSHCLPLFVRNFTAEHAVLKQCSVYGVAQILRFAPALCVEHLPVMVPALLALATMPRVSSEEDEEDEGGNEGVIENALFALGMVCHTSLLREAGEGGYWGAGVAVSEVAALWLGALPFRADEAEARVASRQLCDAVEQGDTLVVGPEQENLSEVLRVLAEVFQQHQQDEEERRQERERRGQSAEENGVWGGGSVHPDTLQRMRALVQQMQTGGGVAPAVLQNAFAVLSADHQAVLQAAL